MQQFIFWFGSIVFLATYVLIASEKVHKTVAALIGASLMLLVVLPGPGYIAETATGDAAKYAQIDVFARYADFNVIFTLAGMMVLVNILSTTGIFQYIAICCAKLAKGAPLRTMILLVLATAFCSAFLDNVTTILLVAPVTLVVCSQLGVPVMPFLIAETMASNIGGTATLIGDPPNLIIGSIAHLDFMAFLVNLAPFVVVILGLYCMALWVYYSPRMHVTVEKRAAIMELDEKAAITDPANLKRGGTVMLLTIGSFLLHNLVGYQPCIVAMSGAVLALLICRVDIDRALEKIEWGTLFFFMGLFILVQGASFCGFMTEIGKIFTCFGNWNPLATILIIMWGSTLCAAVMNNVSFTAAMSAVVAQFVASTPPFAQSSELTRLLWWGLALAVCLGGNATLVGAAANLVTASIAEKAGQKITFKDFLRYGIPVTFGSMTCASIYIAVRYYVVCHC